MWKTVQRNLCGSIYPIITDSMNRTSIRFGYPRDQRGVEEASPLIFVFGFSYLRRNVRWGMLATPRKSRFAGPAADSCMNWVAPSQ